MSTKPHVYTGKPILIGTEHVARMFCRHKGWSPNREAIIITGRRSFQRLRGQWDNVVYKLPSWTDIPHDERLELADLLSTMQTSSHITVGEAPEWTES